MVLFRGEEAKEAGTQAQEGNRGSKKNEQLLNNSVLETLG